MKRRIGYYKDRQKKETGLAWFHQFGQNYEEFETGPGNYPIAIIELDNGEVEVVLAQYIKFLNSDEDIKEFMGMK